MKIQLGLFIRALLDIPAWSNGSPPDSKSGRLGSNPRAGAKAKQYVYKPLISLRWMECRVRSAHHLKSSLRSRGRFLVEGHTIKVLDLP